MYEYRIETKEYLKTVTDPKARQSLFDSITEFARLHDVEFNLLVEEYDDIASMIKGNDAVLFTIEEMPGMYKRKLSIGIVKGCMQEVYGTFNEYGEIISLSYGVDSTMEM